MANPVHNRFKNEHGNNIFILTEVIEDEVHVIAVGPDSTVYHEWTIMEAKVLRDQLSLLLGRPDDELGVGE